MIRDTFKIIAIFITSIIVICYIISLSASIIPAEKSIIIANIGMGIPVIWFFMLLSIIFWFIFKKWKFAICLLFITLISFPIWRNTIVIPINKNYYTDGKEIKILSYNIRLFNFYQNVDNIFAMIEKENADIVCFQEFGYYNKTNDEKQSEKYILKKFKKLYPYNHRWYKNQHGRSDNGLITFSKFPIINKEKVLYDSKYNISILSDIVIYQDTIRLINNHLESNKLTRKQKAIAKDIISDKITSDNIISSTKNIRETLSKASSIRTQQARKVREYIDNSPYPTIVCGDFNDVPLSYIFNTIKGKDLNSAFAMAGSYGYYWTFHENFMFFPIDHILINEKYKIKEAKVIKDKYSDHYPITSTFYISQ